MFYKICSKCKQNLPASSFSKDKSRKDGLQSYCKKCSKIRKQIHYISNKSSYQDRRTKRRNMLKAKIYELKEKHPCNRCKLYFPHFMLDFDHLTDKSDQISNLISQLRSWKKIIEEIKKTQLLCKNCHGIITFERNPLANRPSIQNRPARNYIDSIKRNSWCLDCKLFWPPYILHFDHCRGQKLFDISWGAYNKGVNAVKVEIDKCDLICANCHAARTYPRRIKNNNWINIINS